MASEKNLNAVFTDIANSIRSKKGTTGTIQPVNMASEIDSIETGGSVDVSNYYTKTETDEKIASATPKSTTLAISGTTTTYTFTFNLGANDIIQISPISGDESKFANAGVSTSISGNILTITCVNYVETFS